MKVIISWLCCANFCYGYTNGVDVSVQINNFRQNIPLLSKKCEDHIKEYEYSILRGETWALESKLYNMILFRLTYNISVNLTCIAVLDASAKLPSSGILSGNLVYLGDFDMCLNIIHKSEIFGKYCLGALPLSSGDPEEKTIFVSRINSSTLPTFVALVVDCF